uniref:Uncharacterized protein n=1 Tax=Rangifer tarandus platyrhynchus TaxID=3082113 RepID=A0ACB0F6D0_RANTA|nr:unnamed protein product [Rangifer tarandus platyrhynchus]
MRGSVHPSPANTVQWLLLADDSACVQDGECEAEFSPDGFEEKPEKEKKQTNFTLCNVCNIQLNSTAQAQIHYNGKSHQKRLKQLSNGMVKNDNEGDNCNFGLDRSEAIAQDKPHVCDLHTPTVQTVLCRAI